VPDSPPDVGPVVAALRDDPAFLAARVHAAGAEDEIGARLGLDTPRLQRLLLCRVPASSRFAADVHAIAELVDREPGPLAAVLREVDALVALRGAREPLRLGDAGLLAAAHPADDDHVRPVTDGVERLRELAAAFWARAPETARRHRDVEAAAPWAALLAVVPLPELTLGDVRGWLRSRDVPVAGGDDGLRLRGFLVAWRGIGVAFYDETLDAGERRFTLAHEVGHFLLDYELPRRRVLRDAPDLLELVDGVRPVNASDRAQAVLAGVPVGVHTHPFGTDEGAEAEAEDEASRFALELLSPWDELLDVVRNAFGGRTYQLRLRGATHAVALRFRLPERAARVRARQALDALGVQPGFFER
jgi:hypothetical protein